MSDFRKYLLELEAFYKNQAQCKQSLGGATAALSDERISKLFGHLINEFDAANNRPSPLIFVDAPEDIEIKGDEILCWDGCDYSIDYVEVCADTGCFYMANGTEVIAYAPLPPTQED